MENQLCDIGLIGLAVMGQNLVLNMNYHGFKVCVFNRTVSKVDDFLANEAKETNIVGSKTIEEFVNKLKSPRKIMLLVKAGEIVDSFIEKLLPYITSDDIIIDGGNSDFTDTNRRSKQLKEAGILYVGCGVSGGEDGARYGPSLMPGGDPKAWPQIKEIFQKICAKTSDGEPCCDWAGDEGAGHFVKMVHNGIEYGDMQLISETYHLMREYLGLANVKIADIFEEWNKHELNSYLIEITSQILRFKDEKGECVVDKIRDVAGQKGTGRWTAISGMNNGIPITLIAESVFARCLSGLKDERVEASKRFSANPSTASPVIDQTATLNDLMNALYLAKIISYAQGFMLLSDAKTTYNWSLNLGSIALMWRGGCIIRSKFLGKIKEAFDKKPDLKNLILDEYFAGIIDKGIDSWRRIVSMATLNGVPVPALSSALAFFEGYRSARLPAYLIQAQRDFFGAHQYEIEGQPGKFVHTNWTGHGGSTTSNAYNN